MNHVTGAHSDMINACSFCFSQPLALTAGSDRMIKIWDINTAVSKGKMGCSSGAYCMDVAMSDSVVASGHRDGAVRLWNIRDSKMIHEIRAVHDSLVSSCQYFPGDGNKLITASRDQTVKMIDLRMLKVVASYESESYYTTSDTSQIGISPMGRWVALGSKNGKLIIMDIEKDGKAGVVEDVFEKHHAGHQIVSVDWSRRTSKVASVDNKGNLVVWS